MENSIKVRINNTLNKIKCYLGSHTFGVTEESDFDKDDNSPSYRYKRKCYHCHREETVVESYDSWEGLKQEIIEVGYVGKYSVRKLIRSALVKLNSVFGGVL